jgi:hypothetical protein
MKNFLSYGGGVNSVAAVLLYHELEIEHEAVYVHMPDWPETHEYLLMMEAKGYPVTILFPEVQGHWNLYEYCIAYEMTPSYIHRWCTEKFKIRTLYRYFQEQRPCWNLVGIDVGESHRARIVNRKGIETRYPLIEHGLDRGGCLEIIKRHGLPAPIKSGCFFCCYQGVGQWKELRRRHPELFCKAVALEKLSMENARENNKKHPGFLCNLGDRTIEQIVNERNRFLFKEMEYGPCECGL